MGLDFIESLLVSILLRLSFLGHFVAFGSYLSALGTVLLNNVSLLLPCLVPVGTWALVENEIKNILAKMEMIRFIKDEY